MDLILASASPRRQQMLQDLGLKFSVIVPDILETRLRGEPASNFVQRLARQKAEAAMLKSGRVKSLTEKITTQFSDFAVLAADTIVVHGTLVLGKPKNPDDAVKMLKTLSGKTHEVITGFCWLGVCKGDPKAFVSHVRTKVTFAKMPSEFWRWYVSTGEPLDKAGAYAAQGIGMSFVERVSGSYSNVVGLPLSKVSAAFEKLFGGDLREYCSKGC